MTRRPRILHVLSQRPGRSGSGVFLKAMVREAARREHPQHVVVAGPPGTSAAELPPLGDTDLSLVAFPSEAAPFPVPGNSDVMPYPSTVFSQMTETQVEQYLDAARRVMAAARDRFRPDIVHAHHLWLMTGLAREVFADVPVVATSHNAELRQMIKAPWLAPRVIAGVRAIDRVCVLTEQSRRDTIDAYDVADGRISVTGAGFDDALFHPVAGPLAARRASLRAEFELDVGDEPLVTFVGRLSTPKGVPFLLAACERLLSEGLAFRLLLVGASGSGANGQEMDALVRSAGARVHHLGARSEAAVARLLQASDVFVLPSLFEGLPLTLLEAAGCGCPCVVSALPTLRSWVPEAWHASGCFDFVPALQTTDADRPVPADVPRFVEDLAGRLAGRLKDLPGPGLRTAFAGLLREHTWSAVFARYEQVYAELLAGRR